MHEQPNNKIRANIKSLTVPSLKNNNVCTMFAYLQIIHLRILKWLFNSISIIMGELRNKTFD